MQALAGPDAGRCRFIQGSLQGRRSCWRASSLLSRPAPAVERQPIMDTVMLIELQDIKRHLRLDPLPDSETDPELESMLDAAVDHASQLIGRPIPWEAAEGSASSSEPELVFPPSVRAAILLIIGDLYENREGQVAGMTLEENPAVIRMLHFYRVGLGV